MDERGGKTYSFDERLAACEDRLRFIAEWQAIIGPPVSRLIKDQEFRDHRMAEIDKRWKRWGIRVTVALGGIGVVSGLVGLGIWIAQGITHL